MTKRIMILGAGPYYINLIKNIKALGYYVIVLDKNPNAPGFSIADEYAAIDIFNHKNVYEYAKQKNIHGIMAVNDFGTRASFYCSQKLGLINPSYLSGICGNDKGIMRDIWNHENLPQPQYCIFSASDTIDYIEERIGFPMVIKPTDAGGGGRGISVAYTKNDLIESIEHARPFVKNGRYIAEEFIEGIEVTVDCLVYQGNVYPLAISDKEKPKGKYFVATSLNFPADFPDETIKKIQDIVIQATESLGVSNGATHTELIVNGEQIKLVEMGLRGGGGHVFNTIIEATTGINAPQELAKIVCGERPNLKQTRNEGACYRFFNPSKKGIIQSFHYDMDLVQSEFVIDFGITAKAGDTFNGLIDSMKRIGYVVTKGKNRAEAIQHANLVENTTFFEFSTVEP